jgi:hypothetical protein
LIGIVAALAATTTLLAQDKPELCGKARAMIAAHPDGGGSGYDPADPGERILRESLTDTDVLHNNVDFEIFTGSDSITGSNTVTVRSLVDGLTEFTVRLRSNFTITSATVNGTPVSVTSVGTYGRRATLDRAYNTGEEFEIRFDYTGPVVSRGFGSIEFTQQDGWGPDIVYSLSEPYYAATWWPAKDGDWGEPGDNSDKATLELSVTAPSSMRTVSNGLLVSEVDVGGGRKKTTWASDYPISTYLVAFCSTDYNTWTVDYDYGSGTMPVEFNIYPMHDSSGNRAAWEKCVTMLEVYETIYGLYPFIDEKYGIYECEFGGGMEHQTNTAQGTFSEWITAHELGHQWWGDMITCRTWHDIWLNEGFASYTEALWAERKPGSTGEQALHDWMENRRPGSVSDTVYVYDTSDIGRIFSGTYSYDKASWVLHMLRHAVGDTTFFDILAEYRATYEGGAATTDDFAAVVSDVVGQDMTWYFDQWVYLGGAPAYQYGWQSVNVNGQDYLKLHVEQVQSGSYPVFTMPLDVRVDDAGGSTTYTVWNDEDLEHFVIPIPSPATGVALDDDVWVLWTSNSQVGYVAGPPVVVDASPLPGDDYAAGTGPTAVTITFSDDVSASGSDFAVVGDAAGAVSFTYGYDAGTHTATLDFGSALAGDAYTVTVADTVTAGGKALDGEIADPSDAGSLPSGEGLAGGDAVYTFTVQADCPPDWNGDTVVNSQDFIAFLNGFTAGNADYDGDTTTNSQDFIAFLNDFVAGC